RRPTKPPFRRRLDRIDGRHRSRSRIRTRTVTPLAHTATRSLSADNRRPRPVPTGSLAAGPPGNDPPMPFTGKEEPVGEWREAGDLGQLFGGGRRFLPSVDHGAVEG